MPIHRFNEEAHVLANRSQQSRFHLLHVTEMADYPFFKVQTRFIGLERALALAGFPEGGAPRFATDLRAMALLRTLRHGDLIRAGRIFDLLAAACGAPDWRHAENDCLSDALIAVIALLAEQNFNIAETSVRNLLDRDQPDYGARFARCDWVFLLDRIAGTDLYIRNRIGKLSPGTRAKFDAALAKCSANPTASAHLWEPWSPLLCRLFPRLAA